MGAGTIRGGFREARTVRHHGSTRGRRSSIDRGATLYESGMIDTHEAVRVTKRSTLDEERSTNGTSAEKLGAKAPNNNRPVPSPMV